jgi:hypothetical protein
MRWEMKKAGIPANMADARESDIVYHNCIDLISQGYPKIKGISRRRYIKKKKSECRRA